jgi:signal transduction histidine kinase
MDRLIQDLLDYSRLAKVEIPKEPTRFADVVAEALLQMEAETVARHAQIAVTLPEDLPDVLAHPRTLVQAIVNLVGNALKFVAPGVVPRVHLWGEARENRVRLWVEDNGIGIAPEHRKRIFGVFEQLHPRSKFMGTGVGLAMVKMTVERMDGIVDLESEVGHGSKFWIELPRA